MDLMISSSKQSLLIKFRKSWKIWLTWLELSLVLC